MATRGTRRSDLALLATAVGVAVFALVMHLGIRATNISPAQWARPAKKIRSVHKRGDIIALVPHWALRGAEAMRGLPVLYAENPHTEDLSRYRRLWVVLAPRLGKWWFLRSFGHITDRLTRKYGKPVERLSFGPVKVLRYKLPVPRHVMLFDFASKESVRNASVWHETPRFHGRAKRRSTTSVRKDYVSRWEEQPGRFYGHGGYYFGRTI